MPFQLAMRRRAPGRIRRWNWLRSLRAVVRSDSVRLMVVSPKLEWCSGGKSLCSPPFSAALNHADNLCRGHPLG